MKIRENLVSNSSSTSFIVFHNKVDICTLVEQYSARNFPEGRYYVYGNEGEGTDFFPITTAMFKLIKKSAGNIADLKLIYDVHLMRPAEYANGTFLKKDFMDMVGALPEKFCIENIDVDRCITEDVKDFKERYLNNI